MDGVNETRSILSERPTSDDTVTFEEFFRREHVRLLRAMYLVAGNGQDAEELCQEAFLKVWERWARVGNMSDPTGYLYRTAMNLFRSGYRRSVRMARRIMGARNPRDELEAAEDRDVVMRALAGLSQRQRVALVLTDLLAYGSEEAAGIMGVKAVTVRVLASQARAALRERLVREDE